MYNRLTTLLGATVLMFFAGLPAARAQDAATTPFRAGQLGVNITIKGLTFSSADLLKFTSPTRAWVVSAFALGNSDHMTGGLAPATSTNEGITLSLERRFLRPAHSNVVLYLSPGFLGGFAHNCLDTTLPGGSACGETWQVGLLMEAGAEYVIGTHLGIGARYRAILTYDREDFGGNRLWSVNASAGDIGVFGALLF